ncbi:hypothetical protein P5V15_004214 [Pogonomyrmex californicus]
MCVDKVLLITVIWATSAWCSDQTLMRNARTFDSSFFAWPQMLFRNRLDFSIFPKLPNQSQLQEWTKNGFANLLRLALFISMKKEPMHIEFKPEDGPHAAKDYQQRFGYRGEWLIKQLGNGLDIRLNRQPMPNTFLMPPPIPFKDDSNFS